MKILVDGEVFDSTKTPILIIFDENESKMFNGMKKFVSAPQETTEKEKQRLIDKNI